MNYHVIEKMVEEERGKDADILENKFSKWFLQKISTPDLCKNHFYKDMVIIIHWVAK